MSGSSKYKTDNRISFRYPDIQPIRRRRALKLGTRIAAVSVLSALGAVVAAQIWPFHGPRIQAAFFLSLASSCLTLFGLVFTLCLIGTQLIARRTNIAFRRVFGLLTWFYLGIFLATTLWTLAIAYRAGGLAEPSQMCGRLAGSRLCITETFAGRLSILGITWSLLLLLPFIAYVYRRLSTTSIFSAMAGSVLRARTEGSIRRRTRHIADEILSGSSDPSAVSEGLSEFLELGALGARRRRFSGQIEGGIIAARVTDQLTRINRQLLYDSGVAKIVIEKYQLWATWLISRREDTTRPLVPEGQQHRLPVKHISQMARSAVDAATYNLYYWRTSHMDVPCSRESVRLIQAVADVCEDFGLRVNLSQACEELAQCAMSKWTDGLESDFNMAIRSLITICRTAWTPTPLNIGKKGILSKLCLVLRSLGDSTDERSAMRPWILEDLHNLADYLFFRANIEPDEAVDYLDALVDLKPVEILTILRGSGEQEEYSAGTVHHSAWQRAIVKSIRYSDGPDETFRAERAASALWVTDRDLEGLLSLFDEIATDYLSGTRALSGMAISSVADRVSECFKRVPAVRDSLDLHRSRRADRRRLASLTGTTTTSPEMR
jgi:hypothetical protein